MKIPTLGSLISDLMDIFAVEEPVIGFQVPEERGEVKKIQDSS